MTNPEQIHETRRLLERFDEKVMPEPNTGCWLWSATVIPDGYGMIHMDGRVHLAHRVSWIIHRGEIPNGMLVCHTCDVRCCVNPQHLFLGTNLDNMLDCKKKGRFFNSRKTHCKHGHPFSGENLYIDRATGKRACMICRNAAFRRRDERQKNGK